MIGTWISVDERLPEKDGEYLIVLHKRYASDLSVMAWFLVDENRFRGWSNHDVAHWLDLDGPIVGPGEGA